MQLVHPGLTTTNTKKSKKKLTAKQQKAKDQYEAEQRKLGIHPEQLAAKKKNAKPKKLTPTFVLDKSQPQCSNGFAPAGAKHSIFDTTWKKTYEDDDNLAQREAIALVKAEKMKENLMPLYNKGPVMLKSPDLKMTELGKRR